MAAKQPAPEGLDQPGHAASKVASSAQCRAARALLKWSQARLAKEAEVSRMTVAGFEGGERGVRRGIRLRLTAAFRRHGIEFLWGDDAHGVRSAIPSEGFAGQAEPLS